jgi:hypothetical protein
MTESQFENNLACVFSSEFDPKTKKSMSHDFEKERFACVDDSLEKNFLFKLSCKENIKNIGESVKPVKWTCTICTY